MAAERSVTARQYCGIGNHLLKTPNTRIRDPHMFHFAHTINPELRPDVPLCKDCHDELGKIYRYKVRNALEHRKRKQQQAESISDVSSSQREDVTSSSDPSSTSPDSEIQRLALATAAASKRPTPAPVHVTTGEDDMPTTSAAAAEKRKRSNIPPAAEHVPQSSQSSYVSDDDDPNSNLSLNAVNGTRLPHIQPIPKRRPTVHLNKTAMDIYLAGTTGG